MQKAKDISVNKKELKKLIKSTINSKKNKNFEKTEWDSLSHLTILTKLETKFPNKITSIKGIAEVNNYKDIKKILILKKLLKDD